MLTPKQEKFVQNLVKGMSQREAYKNSYSASKMKDKTIDNRAYVLFKKSEIKARYKELIKKADDEAIMSAVERKKWLTKVVTGEIKHISYDSNGNEYKNEAYIADKMKAIDILNKMDGQYIEKIKLKGDISYQKEKNAIDDLVNQMNEVSEDDL